MPNIDGIKNPSITEDSVSFLYGGDPMVLVRALAEMTFSGLTVTDTELEDSFMHYYEGGAT